MLAGTAVAVFATLGFVTADSAVPGDWNYRLKTTQERVEYALARGDSKVDVQINQTQARVYEIQVLTKRGDISPHEIQKLEDEVAQLRIAVESRPTDDVQKQQLRALQDLSTVVLNAATEKNEAVKLAAASVLTAVTEAVAAGGGGGTAAVREPSVSPTPVPVGVKDPVGTTIPIEEDPTTVAIPTLPTSAGAAPATLAPLPPTATPTSPPATPTETATPETPTATTTPETPTPTPHAATAEPTELTSTAEPAETLATTPEATATPSSPAP